MINRAALIALLFLPCLVVAQTPTTGRIFGTVRDQASAVVVGANVTITNRDTGESRKVTTNESGKYSVALLAPGTYRVYVEARGFGAFKANLVSVNITDETSVNVVLTVAGVRVDAPITVDINSASLMKTDTPTLGQVINERSIIELPLASRNFTQLLGSTAGAATYLVDNSVVGRNTQIFSVNGARASQNNFQINGIDVNAGLSNNLQFANPAPETIADFKVQTSLYDATYGRGGGGNVQIITKSGTNSFHGTVYNYFRNTLLTSNNPFLKAAGLPRPVLDRNVFGATLGGPTKKDRAFFFVSFQTTRERNGASRLNSLSMNVLIDPRLTNDRSEMALRSAFALPSIDPVAFRLLNARLDNGQFVIPTPQANGRYSGSAISLFSEQQFNSNFDFRLTQRDQLSVKFFFSNAPQTLALDGSNVPGFPVEQKNSNHLLALQHIHVFNSNLINEARFGYNINRGDNVPQQPLNDSDLGISRSTADAFPGLPLISINQGAGGNLTFGTGVNKDVQRTAPTTTFANTISIAHSRHSLRLGGELRYYEFNTTANILTRGAISFPTFRDFLIGTTTQFAGLANGIAQRNLRTTDYNFFAQDDWKITSKLTLNVGLRYELDPPPYDTRGRIATFDPLLYGPRTSAANALPQGPPAGGIVQAGNPGGGYDLPEITNVGKRVLESIDPNNVAPRLGFAYSPFRSNRVVLRGGYGIYYSRLSFQYLMGNTFIPPFYFARFGASTPLTNPFGNVPSQDQFPTIVSGPLLFGISFDRRNRTPYLHQYNMNVQVELSKNEVLESAYVGTQGVNLIRRAGINQARLVSPQNPIVNDVTGAVITTNTPNNAQLRAPYQGVAVAVGQIGFNQDQTTGQSNYNSLQMSLSRRFSAGLQFLAAYTFAKSIDNGSGSGGGAGTNGVIDSLEVNDTAPFDGDQRDENSNRGISDFDRTHRFVLSFVWELPKPGFADRSRAGRLLFSNWQMSAIVTAMSGLPINVRDNGAATLFLGPNGGGGRPNWVSGVSAVSNIPPGYYFNPFAFARPQVLNGQIIPSSNGSAIASASGTDFGNVGRNVLRGPRQFIMDYSVSKSFRFNESKTIEMRAEFFNVFNHVNFANPISNLSVVLNSGGAVNPNTGQILAGRAGDFGKIISTSSSPRIIQLAVKFNF